MLSISYDLQESSKELQKEIVIHTFHKLGVKTICCGGMNGLAQTGLDRKSIFWALL